MPRRRKDSPADVLFELVALLPWWGGVALAGVSYLVLHHFAAQPIAIAAAPGQLSATVLPTLGRSLATVGQYLLPILCLAAALASFIGRRKRESLIGAVASSDTAESLNGMTWSDFEKLVGEAYRVQGYRVVETGGGRVDGGVDLVLTRRHEKFLVQCKQWRARQVGVEIVRELYGVMSATGATGGFVVTSGRFTAPAQTFAHGLNITLVDGPQLHELIRQAKGSVPSTVPRAAPSAAIADPGAARPEPASCPVCGSEMVRRIARQGRNAGTSFWGCSTFPTCRGKRGIASQS